MTEYTYRMHRELSELYGWPFTTDPQFSDQALESLKGIQLINTNYDGKFNRGDVWYHNPQTQEEFHGPVVPAGYKQGRVGSHGGKRGIYNSKRSARAAATLKRNNSYRNGMLGKKHSQQTKDLISMIRKENSWPAGNPNQTQLMCPHCGKSGAKPGMVRWHFDNCKDKM